MNASLLTGFVVGGMLLLMLLAFNMRVSQNSGMAVLNQITKQRVEVVAQVAGSDIQKIGQGIGATPILVSNDSTLRFLTTFNTTVAQIVTWQFTPNTPIEDVLNPRVRRLIRVVDNDTTRLDIGISQFTLTYFDNVGNTTTTPEDIRRIRVQVMAESDAPFGNEFARSFWEQDFSPRALQ